MSTPKKAAPAKPLVVARAPSADGSTVPGLRIVARPASFRRAAYEFTGEAREIAVSELSDEQVAMLKAEKQLVVIACDIAVETEAVIDPA